MSVRVTWKDAGFNAIQFAVSQLGKVEARVGVLGAEANRTHPLRNNLTVGDVALLNELGSDRAGVPRRSFLVSTLIKKKRKIVDILIGVARATIFNKVPPGISLATAGNTVALDVVDQILTGATPPPNAPMTVAMKGHDMTLIDTSTLVHSISSDVVTSEGATLMDSDAVDSLALGYID